MLVNKLKTLLLTAGIALTIPVFCTNPVLAEEYKSDDGERTADVTLVPEKDLTVVPEGGLGSITIQLEDSADKRSKEHVQFGVVQVAKIEKGEYILNEPFTNTGLDLNEIKNANEMELYARELSKEIEENSEDVTVLETNAEGKVIYNDVPVGVYLFYVIDVAEYEFITPFLIAIPTWDDIDELMLYDIDVFPKHNQLPKIEVNKVDEATGKNITNSQFEFTSYEDKDCKKKIDTVQGNTETGTAVFMVDYGVTYIKETKAPQGYILSPEVVKIEVNDEGIFVNDKKAESDDELLYSIVYQNSLLPFNNVHTGVNTNLGLYVGLACVAGVSIILICKMRKSKKD